MEADLEIDSLEFKIKTIKENLISNKLNKNNKYINNEEKIYEDTKGSNKTLNIDKLDKRNFDNGVNKITFNKNEIKRPLNYFEKKNFYRNKLFDLFLKNNELNNNKNQINNFLNINVNINLGFNKDNLSSSSIDKEEDNNNSNKSKDDKVNIIFVENDSITESSIQNEENKE